MHKPENIKNNTVEEVRADEQWPGIDSVFRLIIVAAQRAKQLRQGAPPRVTVESKNQRDTYTALEEVKQGKIRFEVINISPSEKGTSHLPPNEAKMKSVEESWLA